MPSNHAENVSDDEADNRVINLSNHHLKRIECLPEGISAFTLLLSNNEISKLENLQYFAHLQQLSLAGNQIDDMKGISGAQGLRVLDLSDNNIPCIEGISSLKNLEWLNLSGNSIEEVENLDKSINLNHLDLSENSVAVISGLRTLKKLKTLLLHGNLISSLAVIKDELSTSVCTLSLADNDISDLNEIVNLSSLVNLEQLSLVNNPCVMTNGLWRQEINYRPYLAYCCANLRNLDGCLVTNQERVVARLLNQAFHQIGLPSCGQHQKLVTILQHVHAESVDASQDYQGVVDEDLDGDTLLESESLYIPVPPSEMEQPLQEDPIMTEEEALRLLSLAATIIQAHVRGYLVRKKFDFCQYRQQKNAAACIQAAWKGYRARTRDIKVVNIRNELRMRRLISVINNLYSMLDREHEEAVNSRENLKKVIKYFWFQIQEQKRANHQQYHKERQVKAAIKIQTWWRGYMSRKALPMAYKSEDEVCTLFEFCRHIQMQLDEVKSKLNKFVQGEGQDSFPGLKLLPAESVHQVDKFVDQQSGDTEGKGVVAVPLESGNAHTGINVSTDQEVPSQNGIGPSHIIPLRDEVERAEDELTTKLADQVIQEVYKVALTDHPSGTEVNDICPLNLNGNQLVDNVDETTSEGNDEQVVEESELGPAGLDLSKAAPVECDPVHKNELKSMSFNGQESALLETEACNNGVKVQNEDSFEARGDDKCLGSGPNIEAQMQQRLSEDSTDVGIPAIIVSSPMGSGDESCDDAEGIEVETKVKQRVAGNQVLDERLLDTAASQKSQTTVHVITAEKQKGKEEQSTDSVLTSEEASSRTQSQGRVSAQASPIEGQRIVPNLGERAINLLSQLRFEIASMKSARLSGVLPSIAPENDDNDLGGENKTAVAGLVLQECDLSHQTLQEHDKHQVMSDTCGTSDQTSRKGDTPETLSLERGVVQATSQEHQPVTQDNLLLQSASRERHFSDDAMLDFVTLQRDSFQVDSASTVTYRLPLFEDVDSTCTSLSLDDYDPGVEEIPDMPSG